MLCAMCSQNVWVRALVRGSASETRIDPKNHFAPTNPHFVHDSALSHPPESFAALQEVHRTVVSVASSGE